MKYAKQRDANEGEIVTALEAAGAAVQRLGEPGVPDLLVSFSGVLHLIEVKRVRAGKKVHMGDDGDERGLTPTQTRWWAKWRGKPPVIVQTAEEALRAIGAVGG